jgi:TPR repeat protein
MGRMLAAAQSGDPKAQFSLGTAHWTGQGVPQNDAAATSWWRKAVRAGNIDAAYSLGIAYQDGRGVPQDHAKAAALFARGAAKGDAES